MNKSEALGRVAHYERILSDMASRTIYMEDDEGVLRRWYPPRPIPHNSTTEQEGE